MSKRRITIKRAYDAPSADDGTRILIDRIWPRGVAKSKAKIDIWAKELAPSTELRKWFDHDPERWSEFCRRYRQELAERSERIADLLKEAGSGPITLVFAAKDTEHNNAVVLEAFLKEKA